MGKISLLVFTAIAVCSSIYFACFFGNQHDLAKKATHMQALHARIGYNITTSQDTADVLFGIAMAEKGIASVYSEYSQEETDRLKQLSKKLRLRLENNGVISNPFFEIDYRAYSISTKLANNNSLFRTSYFFKTLKG